MTQPPHDEPTAAGPEELREQVEQTRQKLGETVNALAAKTDVKGGAKEKAADVKRQAGAKAEELKTKAADAASQVQDKLPEPVREKAAQGARGARENRTALLVAVGIAMLWLARRRRKGWNER
ncbi:DUF3618 domain-containing protein [Streptomyces sp. RTd22]|uniref:DUF3618 domain-containing protein n=1 Tax=Streptomyces sp. RTd22 TaxID=1841249 RepID=UPI0007C446F1|nr:DUF3618 domain-containing protein [Streptomyces sp. RTd22]